MLFFPIMLKMLNTCVVLNTDNTIEIKKLNHKDLSHLLGTITFVGAVPEFNAFAVGSKDCGDVVNAFCKNGDCFETNVCGKVILIGSDENGEAIDLDDAIVDLFKPDSTSIVKLVNEKQDQLQCTSQETT